jgi:hypothetical protein
MLQPSSRSTPDSVQSEHCRYGSKVFPSSCRVSTIWQCQIRKVGPFGPKQNTAI